MIYFFNMKSLVEELKVKRSRSRENFQYCLAFMIEWSLLSLLSAFSKQQASEGLSLSYFFAALGLMIVVFLIGFWMLSEFYEANGGEAGEYFLDRLIALFWVASMRISIVCILLSLAIIGVGVAFAAVMGRGVVILGAGLILLMLFGSVFYLFKEIKCAFVEIHSNEQVTPNKGAAE